MVVALGVTTKGGQGLPRVRPDRHGERRGDPILLWSLKDRGLDLSAGALVVIDGARGLRSGVLAVFKGQVLIQRCQWHKRENVISYLPRAEQKGWRPASAARLSAAHVRGGRQGPQGPAPGARGGETSPRRPVSMRGSRRPSPLHRLGVFPLVGQSLKTTNVLESVNALAEQRCGRVDHWEELEPEAPMARHCAPGDRASAPEVARVPTPPAPQGRDPEGPRDHPSREPFTCCRLRRRSLQFQLTLGLTRLVEQWRREVQYRPTPQRLRRLSPRPLRRLSRRPGS